MEIIIGVVAGCFILLVFAVLFVNLVNTIFEIKATKNNSKRRETRQYILEVSDVGEIKLKKINRGGGI